MSELFKLLVEVGLTPINALLVVGISALGFVVKFLFKKQNDEREAWHADTRLQLDKTIADRQTETIENQKRFSELNQHFEKCNDDRATLKDTINSLDARVKIIELCPKKEECPFRKS